MLAVLREVFAYVFFLVLLVLTSRHHSDPRAQLQRQQVFSLLGTDSLPGLITGRGLWEWAGQTLVEGLYGEADFSGQPWSADDLRLTSDLAQYRVGPVRLRQVRLKTGQCSMPKETYMDVVSCSGQWSWSDQSEEAYTPGWQERINSTELTRQRNYAWHYRTFLETKGLPVAASLAVYPAGGYVADLIGSRDRVREAMAELEEAGWLDQLTRALFVEVTVYNANVNLFTRAMVVAERLPTGFYLVTVQIHPFRLFAYLGGYGVVIALCDALTLVFILYLLWRALRKAHAEGLAYLTSFWNFLELANLVSAIVAVVMYVGRNVVASSALQSVTKLRDKFYNFQRLASWDEMFGFVMGFVVFTAIIKVVHLLRFNRRMCLLARTLKTAARELSAFVVVLAVFLTAFMALSLVTFGPNMEEYHSVLTAYESLLSFALGQYQFEELSAVNRILGPIFFFSYVLFMVMMLLNMFISILNDSFTAARGELTGQSNDYEIVEFMALRLQACLSAIFGSRPGTHPDKPPTTEKYATDPDESGQSQELTRAVTSMHRRLSVLELRLDAILSDPSPTTPLHSLFGPAHLLESQAHSAPDAAFRAGDHALSRAFPASHFTRLFAPRPNSRFDDSVVTGEFPLRRSLVATPSAIELDEGSSMEPRTMPPSSPTSLRKAPASPVPKPRRFLKKTFRLSLASRTPGTVDQDASSTEKPATALTSDFVKPSRFLPRSLTLPPNRVSPEIPASPSPELVPPRNLSPSLSLLSRDDDGQLDAPPPRAAPPPSLAAPDWFRRTKPRRVTGKLNEDDQE